MICTKCSTAADITADPDLTAASTLPVVVRRLHDQCKGCDCQHVLWIAAEPSRRAAPDSIVIVEVDDQNGSILGVRCGDVALPYAVESRPRRPDGDLGLTAGDITQLEVGPVHLTATGCRSEIPVAPSGDSSRVGWTCDGDPEQLVEVGRLGIAYPNGRGRRVPIVAPRELWNALPADNPRRQAYSYAIPYGGERDHVHLDMRSAS